MVTGMPEYRDVNPRGVLPGYKGFVPGARDKFGGTTYGGGMLTVEYKSWGDDSSGYFFVSHDGISHLKEGAQIRHKKQAELTGISQELMIRDAVRG